MDKVLDAASDEERLTKVSELGDQAEEADVAFLLEEIPKALDQSAQGLGSIANIVRAMKDFSHPGKESKSMVDLGRAIENTITVAGLRQASTRRFRY